MPSMKTTIDLPPDLVRCADEEEIALPELIVRLLRRHLHRLSKKSAQKISPDEPLDWRQELL